MIALYRKELRSAFTSWTGYIYLAVFSLISGFIFTTGNLLSQNGDIKSYFASICTVLVFLVPILTMRVFAEERKLRTLQLLLTMPLSLGDIVAGKFLATLTVFCIGLVPTLAYPLILAGYGSVELAVIAGNYLGLLMLVSAFAGHDEMRALYRHAIESQYRFFSYGDAMLLDRQAGSPHP